MMIKTLLRFILFCIRVSFAILRIAIAFLRLAIISALLPRMPLSNWRKEQAPSSVVDAGQVSNLNIRNLKLGKRGEYILDFSFFLLYEQQPPNQFTPLLFFPS